MKINYKKAKGITLIALVITIIILLILAGISISALTQTGIFEKAKQAEQKSKEAQEEENTTLGTYEDEINNYLDGNKEYSAKVVKANPKEYYGKSITNYKGYNKESSGYAWQIYYSDGDNIYLTTTDYIKAEDCPKGKKGTSVDTWEDNTYMVFLDDMINQNNDYTSSEDIKDARITKWLNYLNKGMTSTGNIKATAYLLDTNVWNNYYKGTKAEYAVGAPTLDLFVASYNDTHADKKIEIENVNKDYVEAGYRVKWSTDENYSNKKSGITVGEFNGLYLTLNSTVDNINGQYLASPSAKDSEYVMTLSKYDYEDNISLEPSMYIDRGNNNGVRPLVCLEKDVILEADGSGYKIK